MTRRMINKGINWTHYEEKSPLNVSRVRSQGQDSSEKTNMNSLYDHDIQSKRFIGNLYKAWSIEKSHEPFLLGRGFLPNFLILPW